MKKRRLIVRASILFVMTLAIGYTFFLQFTEERGLVDTGDVVPNFILKDVNGNKFELDDYKGKGVYLTFWATYCKYCTAKMEYLKEHYEKYKEKGVEIIAVNVDESSVQVQSFIDRHQVPYPNPIDRNMLVSNAYGVTALPHTLLLDEEGIVIERKVGGKTEAEVVEALEKVVPK
ncbi:alkyl hydroperoxide reductase [Salipaludibacillus neizhouensis]|uniref:Alkyl hydroperoxide reductase n=1 Tax=Salipaludibacillus neizhouensis TaxID=885475 RepID=A0A3A9K8B1_9BACI|nr:thiol-disulfide oxidoreductase ResA [Salipaludibacillus neizhouensis]RKL69234.1 alkyl hydroperoxide reductase [Salipaludibacillus neizhouensis]